jgi:hypothetical protein
MGAYHCLLSQFDRFTENIRRHILSRSGWTFYRSKHFVVLSVK